jgi:hypothetical protein
MASNTWEEVETQVRGRVMVKVSSRIGERDNTTLYSMRVGTAQMLDDGTTRVSAHMSIYDVPVAIELLQELSTKYQAARAEERQKRGIASRYRAAGGNGNY